jgi:hypothetical protein
LILQKENPKPLAIGIRRAIFNAKPDNISEESIIEALESGVK